MEWFDYSIPFCPPGGLDSNKFNALECMFNIQVKDKLFGEDWLKCFATEILDARYEKTDVVMVMKGLTHLNAHQIADLLWVLQENKKMFKKILMFIHMTRYTLTLIQMPSLCILCLTQYLEFIWRLSKKDQQSTLDQQLTSTQHSHET